MENGNIVVSFCIPTYNRVNFVLDCIEHIQKIDSKFIEIIVVDNNSSDDTEEKIKEILEYDSRVKYYKNYENIGQSRNIIRVLSLAKGKYLYLTSDEDLVNSDFFQEKLNEFKKSDFSLIIGSLFDLVSNQYYLNEKDFLFKEVPRFVGQERIAYRHYLSGILFNAKYLDFKKLEFYTTYQDNLYAYIPAILMCIRHGSIKSYKEIICFMQSDNVQYTDYDLNGIKLHFTSPISRTNQINFWKTITNELIEHKRIKKRLLFSLGRMAANIAYNSSQFDNDMPSFDEFKRNILKDKDLRNGFFWRNLVNSFKSFFKKLTK